MAAKATLLVHGLREESTGTAVDTDNADTEDRLWRRISDALLSRWPKPSPSPSTARAEKGLGILSSPYYFYVMRAHRVFGYVVFLFEEIQTSAKMPPHVKGATPFDTGGLWVGKIHPINSNKMKQGVFANEEVELQRWKAKFLSYINRNYSDAKDYVNGKPPAHGIRGVTNQAPPNEARAWTWEVRYPSSITSSWLRLESAYMHRDDYTDYLDWLPRSDYEDNEITRLTTLVNSKVEAYEDATMASHRAEAALLKLI